MKSGMEPMDKRTTLSEVALGNIAPDTVFINGTLFNAFTGEFIPGQSVWIKDGMIAYTGADSDPQKGEGTSTIDADGMVLLPGLIEGHTHLNRMGIEEFTRYVLPTGVTTVIMETIEVGLVGGKRGLEQFAKGVQIQPLRFYYTLSPMCGLISAIEVKAPSRQESIEFLNDPHCIGIGEIYWANIFTRGEQSRRVRELVSLTIDVGKRVEGHTAGAPGRKLQAYACLGPSSCHESTTEDEVMERLRLGYWTMVREGSIRQELEGVKGVFKREIDFRRMILITDGVDPERFIEQGYLNAAVRKALRIGVPPKVAYQMVTLNVAEHFRLDHLIGSLSPGKAADLVMIPRPEEFSPQLILSNGKTLFSDGKALVEPVKVHLRDEVLDTVHITGHEFPSLPQKGKARVIELVTRLVTKESVIDLEDPREKGNVVMALAIDRLGRDRSFLGLLKGLGLKRGAYGSTMTWDTGDLLVVGCDPLSMRTAIDRLKEIRGGGVFAVGKDVVVEISTPYCGGMSLKPMRTIYEEMKRVEEALMENGIAWEKPGITIDTLTTPAIPHLRITHEGYVRLKDRAILPLEV
jgi:adenine deaminase